jgi:D-alanyl-D-alanine carboxypeptidase
VAVLVAAVQHPCTTGLVARLVATRPGRASIGGKMSKLGLVTPQGIARERIRIAGTSYGPAANWEHLVVMRMKIGLLFACVAGCTGTAPPPGPEPTSWEAVEPALAARFEAALEAARAEQGLPGLAMAVAYRDSRRSWVSAAGFSNLTAETRWRPSDESRIGSVTKTFTTAIVLELVEEGRLSLDDAIETWVPGWYEGPTLRQLLGHTSGIVSYNYVGDFDVSRAWTPDELVQWAYDHEPSLRFVPGTAWEYSNTNFVLLGMVIEEVTGQSYAEALRTRLFEPLELDMRLALSGDDSPELVRSYDGTPPVDSSRSDDPSYGWAAGGIVSTPADLARWIVALYGGELVSSTSLEWMTTPNGATAPEQEDYGLGTIIENDGGSGLTLVGHTGGIGGYATHAFYLADENVAVVLMANWREIDLRAASNHAWAAVLGIPYP